MKRWQNSAKARGFLPFELDAVGCLAQPLQHLGETALFVELRSGLGLLLEICFARIAAATDADHDHRHRHFGVAQAEIQCRTRAHRTADDVRPFEL